MISTNELRMAFLSYMKRNGHIIEPSSSLIPANDPTLMFANSGMVQFKNCFIGLETPKASTITTVQKCVRAGGKHNDLENVGYTARHHTFFEMLGNFSFGAYFKEEAIKLAWNFLTQDLGLDKNKLYTTVYHEDDEALALWKKIAGLSDDRIIKIATSDNFWQMGDTGPCGPCSEIFYDHGDKIFGGLPGTHDQDGDRYVEIWNLVFMQYEMHIDGSMTVLPRPCIDTGAGLERLAAVLQNTSHNYEIDTFKAIINASIAITGARDHIESHRVIADHLRASAFLIADGVTPANEGRGYVLRRIMRRAMRHVEILGYSGHLLTQLLPTLIAEMSQAYPELERGSAAISSILESEEAKFRDMLKIGMRLLNQAIQQSTGTLNGAFAFKLYDTYGFPLDLTKDILKAHGISVDELGFNTAMNEQQHKSKASWTGSGEQRSDAIWFEVSGATGPTEFVGYETDATSAEVVAIVSGNVSINTATETDGDVIIVLDKTPFYAESGGQIGDSGAISGHIVDTTKLYPGGVFGHHVRLNSSISVGGKVDAFIDVEKRRKICANHSATHMLHNALRNVLGTHVMQKGSLVSDERLRFDFAHNKPLTVDEILQIEALVMQNIMLSSKVEVRHMGHTEAVASGAIALFGEKYSDNVRVVCMGQSVELCGGTHVHNSSDICCFKIIAESSIGSGIRRIEAYTGLMAYNYMNSKVQIIEHIARALKCSDDQVNDKIAYILEDKAKLQKEYDKILVKCIISNIASDILGNILHYEADITSNIARLLVSDLMSSKEYKIIAIIFGKCNDNMSIIIGHGQKTNEDALKADCIINDICKAFAGKGGGNPALAQAGGLKTSPKELMKFIHNLLN